MLTNERRIALLALAVAAVVPVAAAQDQPDEQEGEATASSEAPPAPDAHAQEIEGLRAQLAQVQEQLDQARLRRQADERARIAVAVERGRAVYHRYCETCHGRRGDGRGPSARFLRVAPRDFTRGAYKWRTTPTGSLPLDSDLLRTVRRGVPGTSMPAWRGRVPHDDLLAVVQYVKTFSARFTEEDPQEPISLPRHVPDMDDAQAIERGRNVFVIMRCWTCHGIRGDGDGPAADTLHDDWGRPIHAYNFTEGRFHSGGRPIDVYRTFSTGLNGTPMPSFDDALLVGREMLGDLSPYHSAVGSAGVARLRAFARRLPTSDQLDAMSDEARLRQIERVRWDLVSYVLSLSRGGSFWRFLTRDPYVSE